MKQVPEPAIDGPEGDLVRRIADLEESNRELSRSNAELVEFASLAAHELRSPLQTITLLTEVLASHGRQLDSDEADCVDGIQRSADRLRALVEDLLAYARVGTVVRRREDVDCAQLVADSRESLRARLAETGATVLCRDLPVVVGDPGELAVVFQNLIANGLKFGRPEVAPTIDVSAQRVGQDWQFNVTDNGIGIEPRNRERVFRVFQRLSTDDGPVGSGIGLATCRRIVEGHGGRIWADVNPDGPGARLSFTIPAPVCWSPF